MRTLLMFVGVVVVAFLVMLSVGMFAANGFVTGVLWLTFQLALLGIPLGVVCDKRRRRRREVLARCEYEHAALCRGDIARGLYGGYQPPSI